MKPTTRVSTLVGIAFSLGLLALPFVQAEGTCNGCDPEMQGEKDNTMCRDNEALGTSNNCCADGQSGMVCAAGYYAVAGGDNCGFFGGKSFDCYNSFPFGGCRCRTSDDTCLANTCQCALDASIQFCSGSSCSNTHYSLCPASPTFPWTSPPTHRPTRRPTHRPTRRPTRPSPAHPPTPPPTHPPTPPPIIPQSACSDYGISSNADCDSHCDANYGWSSYTDTSSSGYQCTCTLGGFSCRTDASAKSDPKGLSIGVIAGIAIGGAVVLIVVGVAVKKGVAAGRTSGTGHHLSVWADPGPGQQPTMAVPGVTQGVPMVPMGTVYA